MADRLRLGIVQDYVPGYRVGFFTRVIDRLAEKDIETFVIAGHPRGAMGQRGDQAQSARWIRSGRNRQFTIGRDGPCFSGFISDRNWRDCDGVILGLRGTALDLYAEIAKKRFSGRKLGVFGHLSRHVRQPNPVDLAIERWQMRHSDHVFTYTQAGVDVAAEAGVEPDKITAVMNSVDIQDVLDAYNEVDAESIDELAERYSLTPGKVFGYIGGLDADKRIAFLVDALDRIWQEDPEIKVLVGGKGEQADLLARAIERGQVIMLGFAGPEEKATTFRLSQSILCPGRVGLVAVETLALGIPLLTTDWPFHAPEIEYLTPGTDIFLAQDSPHEYARLVLEHVNHGFSFPRHVGNKYPTIDEMANNFARGVEAMF